MSLEDLEKKLYEEEVDFKNQPLAPETPQIPGEQAPFKAESWKVEEESGFILAERNKKIFKIAGIVIGGLAVCLIGFFVWRFFFYFNSSKISLEIYAPDRIVSGEELNYVVRYKNRTRMDLKEAKMLFYFPEHSIISEGQETTFVEGKQAGVFDLGSIKAGGEGQTEFRASVIGLKDEKKIAQVKLIYKTGDVSSLFENSAEFESEIILVPIVLNFELPEKSVSGQQLDFFLKYLNTADSAFYDVVLQIDFPVGFDLASASPAASRDQNVWILPELSPKEEGKIAFFGKLNGTEDEIKTFQARAGFEEDEVLRPVSEGLASTKISAAPLSIEIFLNDKTNDSAWVGETLNYTVRYKNTVDLPISSVYMTASLSSKVLDFSSLQADSGFFNNLDNTITWNESSFPDFKMVQPGQEGTLDFSVDIKERLPISGFADKNFIVKTKVAANSSNIPISLRGTQLGGADEIVTKINSKLVLDAKAFYNDSLFDNSGPLPPRVGQQTTYSIYWQIMNIGNDLENVTIESYLPPNVKWLGNFQPSSANISYNQNTGKLVWRIGNLAANTGILTPVKQVGFQVGLLPASNQVGDTVQLIQDSQISGKDLFTQTELGTSDDAIESDLPDDASVGYEMGKVAN